MSVKEKLIEKLEMAFAKEGIYADNFRISFPTGFWKSQDVYRWEGYCKIWHKDGRDPEEVSIASWDSASECVKKGDLKIQRDSELRQYEVWAHSSTVK